MSAEPASADGCWVQVGTTAVPSVIVDVSRPGERERADRVEQPGLREPVRGEALGLGLDHVGDDRRQVGRDELVGAVDPDAHAGTLRAPADGARWSDAPTVRLRVAARATWSTCSSSSRDRPPTVCDGWRRRRGTSRSASSATPMSTRSPSGSGAPRCRPRPSPSARPSICSSDRHLVVPVAGADAPRRRRPVGDRRHRRARPAPVPRPPHAGPRRSRRRRPRCTGAPITARFEVRAGRARRERPAARRAASTRRWRCSTRV